MEFLRHNRLVFHFLMGVVLAVIYPMQELFSGNQNVYFLWGMAGLQPDTFALDPILDSPDPYPLFSWLISLFPFQFLGIWTTTLYVFLSSVYTFSLFGIADRITPLYKNSTRLFSFSTLFLFLHSSPIWGTYFQLVFDIDLRWMWDSGIAEQGVLRGYLQPSVFGVFLLLSMYLTMQRKYVLAILCIAPAAIFHAGYLFLGGILTLIYLIHARFEKRTLLASLLLFVMILPYSIYLTNHFLLLEAETKSLINSAVSKTFETNLHINPKNWGNAKLLLQFTILFLGFFALRKDYIKKLYFGILSISVALTVIAYLLDSTTLISLNPWRFSVLLVPISVVALASRVIANGIWGTLKPIGIGLAGSICVMLVYYRVLGNSSPEFLFQWSLLHLIVSLGLLTITFWLSQYEWFSKKLNTLLIVALVVVGLTDMFIEQKTKSNSEQFQAITVLKGSEPNTIYIVPSSWTSFRMNARKAVYADENLVYGPALPSLMERLETVASSTETNDYSSVVGSTPAGTTVKLIAPSTTEILPFVSKKALTDDFSCFTLRQ